MEGELCPLIPVAGCSEVDFCTARLPYARDPPVDRLGIGA
ncbi:MAG: hypothetical protein JWP70_186 [Leifsonia sp.]|jgi:hypothetical protein|nr:hypothetical protein [Leifsonia sp.]